MSERHDGGDHHNPADGRQNCLGLRPLPYGKAGRKQGQSEVIGLLDQPGQEPGQVGE